MTALVKLSATPKNSGISSLECFRIRSANFLRGQMTARSRNLTVAIFDFAATRLSVRFCRCVTAWISVQLQRQTILQACSPEIPTDRIGLAAATRLILSGTVAASHAERPGRGTKRPDAAAAGFLPDTSIALDIPASTSRQCGVISRKPPFPTMRLPKVQSGHSLHRARTGKMRTKRPDAAAARVRPHTPITLVVPASILRRRGVNSRKLPFPNRKLPKIHSGHSRLGRRM